MKKIAALGAFLCLLTIGRAADDGPHFATGMRMGEVSQDRAIIWGRLTAHAERNWDGVEPVPLMSPALVYVTMPDLPVSSWEGAVPGRAGRMRAGVGPSPDLHDARWTEWVSVDASTDFI